MTYENCSAKTRIDTLRAGLDTKGCMIQDPIDLFYLTGLNLSRGRLLLTKQAACLFVDGRYFQTASEIFPSVRPLTDKEEKKFLETYGITEIVFDSAKTTCADLFERRSAHPEIRFTPVPYVTKELRLIKAKEEIDALTSAAEVLWKGFLRIRSLLKEGITEKAVANAFAVFCLENGADGLAFDPIIAFGENSAMPHHRAGNRALQQGDFVLIDIGAKVRSYHSDMTRTLWFGDKDPELLRLETIVFEAQRAALALCKPGTKFADLDLSAREVFRKYDVEALFVHNLGHGVGLEIHEFPRIRFDSPEGQRTLEPGMVFTVEPGLYLPGKGGARYEDTVVITEEGYCNLTPHRE